MSAFPVKGAESYKNPVKINSMQHAAFTAFAMEAKSHAIGTGFVLKQIRQERKCDDVPKTPVFNVEGE